MGVIIMERTLIEDYLDLKDVIQDQIDDLIFGLIKARKKNKITQIKLSQMTGIPQTTISRVESFSTIPTLQILLKIANALGFSLVLTRNVSEVKDEVHIL